MGDGSVCVQAMGSCLEVSADLSLHPFGQVIEVSDFPMRNILVTCYGAAGTALKDTGCWLQPSGL